MTTFKTTDSLLGLRLDHGDFRKIVPARNRNPKTNHLQKRFCNSFDALHSIHGCRRSGRHCRWHAVTPHANYTALHIAPRCLQMYLVFWLCNEMTHLHFQAPNFLHIYGRAQLVLTGEICSKVTHPQQGASPIRTRKENHVMISNFRRRIVPIHSLVE